MLGKKSSQKIAKNLFFYIHTIIVSKKWGEKRAKQFFHKHTNRASKNGKKIIAKSAKKRFLYTYEYRDKK